MSLSIYPLVYGNTHTTKARPLSRTLHGPPTIFNSLLVLKYPTKVMTMGMLCRDSRICRHWRSLFMISSGQTKDISFSYTVLIKFKGLILLVTMCNKLLLLFSSSIH